MANLTRNIAPSVVESDVTFQTTVDLTNYIYKFVNISTTGVIALVTGNSQAFVAGVCQDFPVPAPSADPNALNNCTVRCGGLSLITLGVGGCAEGQYLRCDLSATAVVAVATEGYHAVALSAGVVGDRILCLVQHGTVPTIGA